MSHEIENKDCLTYLRSLEANSVDSIITDPPYFLTDSSGEGFMNKSWDSIGKNKELEVLWQSGEFAQYVIGFFKQLQIEESTAGGGGTCSKECQYQLRPQRSSGV
jgi:DNA modification methylase